jgi:hypothetical protein
MSVTQIVRVFVAVGIQDEQLLFVACPDQQQLYTLSHKRHDFHDFRKKDVEYKMCVQSFSTIFV